MEIGLFSQVTAIGAEEMASSCTGGGSGWILGGVQEKGRCGTEGHDGGDGSTVGHSDLRVSSNLYDSMILSPALSAGILVALLAIC